MLDLTKIQRFEHRFFLFILYFIEFDDSKPEVPPKPNLLQNQDTYLEPMYLTK